MGTAASYSRSVKCLSRSSARSSRVYYSPIAALLALLVVTASIGAPRALAQIELSWSPSMVKGPPGAPVTIVEFSDYQ
jgi:protein-disulfide isomerase